MGLKEPKKIVPLPKLLAKAVRIFNTWIRKRDEGRTCISCGRYKPLQAGHFYSAGHYSHMRFLEDNVNGQCLPCNYYKSGNLLRYRANLVKRIGNERVEKLDIIAGSRGAHKTDRFYLEEIIAKYK